MRELGVVVAGWEFECCQVLPEIGDNFLFYPSARRLSESISLSIPPYDFEIVVSDIHQMHVDEREGVVERVHFLHPDGERFREETEISGDSVEWVVLVVLRLPG
jgi:hypothetical protein